MAQPFDYTIPSPQGAFQASFAFGQQIAAQRAAQAKAEQEAMQAQQAREAMQMVYNNPTPENISKFYMMYPAYKEQFDAARQPLNDAAKADDLNFSSRMVALLKNNAVDQAYELMQSRITALKNTPGKEKEAAATEAIAEMVKKTPKAADALLSMKVSAADPNAYKNVFGNTEMTSFQKDLAAAGIDPESPEGKAKAAEYVQLKIDPIVEIETPDRGKFVGPQSEYYRRYGTGAPVPQIKSVPRIGEVRNGYRFNGGNPGDKANWSKVEGGGSGNAAGGFQGGAR